MFFFIFSFYVVPYIFLLKVTFLHMLLAFFTFVVDFYIYVTTFFSHICVRFYIFGNSTFDGSSSKRQLVCSPPCTQLVFNEHRMMLLVSIGLAVHCLSVSPPL